MLVGRRVEHQIGPVRFEHAPHPRLIEDVSEGKLHRYARTKGLQVVADVEQGILSALDDDEPPGAIAEDLSTDLRPDRTAPSCDEHDPVADHLLDRRIVEDDRLPAEEIADLHRPEHARGGDGPPRSEQFAHRGNHLHARTEFRSIAEEATEHRPGDLPGGDENLVDRTLPEHRQRVADAAEHPDPGDPRTAEEGIVVEKPDNDVRRRLIRDEVPRQEFASLGGADDQR